MAKKKKEQNKEEKVYILVEPCTCNAEIHMFESYDAAYTEFKDRKNRAKRFGYCLDLYLTEVIKSVTNRGYKNL